MITTPNAPLYFQRLLEETSDGNRLLFSFWSSLSQMNSFLKQSMKHVRRGKKHTKVEGGVERIRPISSAARRELLSLIGHGALTMALCLQVIDGTCDILTADS